MKKLLSLVAIAVLCAAFSVPASASDTELPGDKPCPTCLTVNRDTELPGVLAVFSMFRFFTIL